jgi:hypothetical protein
MEGAATSTTTDQQSLTRSKQFRDASDCDRDCSYCTGPETD